MVFVFDGKVIGKNDMIRCDFGWDGGFNVG